MMTLKIGTVLFIALASGITVSAAITVATSVLGIIPQLASVTGTRRFVKVFSFALWAGLTFFGFIQLLDIRMGSSPLATGALYLMELLSGIYTGVWLCALAEVLDIFPTLNKNINLAHSAKLIVITLALAKTLGTLVYYLTDYFQF